MPTYDYHCDACENEFEHFLTMTSPHLKKCPKCGKNKLRRLFGTGAALVFKGSGFYTTDYRSESYQKAAKADSSGESKASSEGKSSGEGGSSGDKKTSTEGKTTTDSGTAKPEKKKPDGRSGLSAKD